MKRIWSGFSLSLDKIYVKIEKPCSYNLFWCLTDDAGWYLLGNYPTIDDQENNCSFYEQVLSWDVPSGERAPYR